MTQFISISTLSQYAWLIFCDKCAQEHTLTAHTPTAATNTHTHTRLHFGNVWVTLTWELLKNKNCEEKQTDSVSLPTTLQTIMHKDVPQPSSIHPICKSFLFCILTDSPSASVSLHVLVPSRSFKQPIIGSCQQRTAGSQGMPVESQVSWVKPAPFIPIITS